MNFTWAVIKTLVTLQYASCFFGILVMVYEIIPIWTRVVSSPVYTLKQPGAFFSLLTCFFFFFFRIPIFCPTKKSTEKKTHPEHGTSLGKTVPKNMNTMIYLHDPFMVYPYISTWIVDFYGKVVGKYTVQLVQLKPTKRISSSSSSTSRSRPQESASDVDKLTSVVFTMPGHYWKFFFPVLSREIQGMSHVGLGKWGKWPGRAFG